MTGVSNSIKGTVFPGLAILVLSLAVLGSGLVFSRAALACAPGTCEHYCTAAMCSDSCCSGCSFCTQSTPVGGRYHFGQPQPDPKLWYWAGVGTNLGVVNGLPQNICIMIPLSSLSQNVIRVGLSSDSPTGRSEGSIELLLRGQANDTGEFSDAFSDFYGTTVSYTKINQGGIASVAVCFSFQNMQARLDANNKSIEFSITVGSRDQYGTGWSNTSTAEAKLNHTTTNQTEPPLIGDENGTLPASLAFRNTISMYVPEGEPTLQRLSGACGIYKNGALQEVAAIENGVLNFDVPTDGVSFFEISTSVNDELFGTFGLRFEIVDGTLRIYDESRNDQEIDYFENSDGTYRLDFWNYETRVHICGESQDADSSLVGPAYLQAQD